MRKKNFKGRCEKRNLPKFDDVCRTFDDVMFACADFLSQKEDITKIRCNVPLDGTDFTTDFVCTKADDDICVFECVDRKHLTKPMTAKLLDEINETAALHDITPKTLRKYLCTYLATNDIGSLAPTKKAVRSLTSDEKNIRRALNKYYYTHAKHTLKTAYTMMLKDSYTNEFGTLLSPYPSYYQFRYCCRKLF